MAQFGRPISDITTTEISSGTFADIDETSPNDSDFIVSNDNAAATYECALTASLVDPLTGSNHTARARVSKSDTGVPDSNDGNAVEITISLFQGTTQIQIIVNGATLGLWNTFDISLTPSLVDNITDYTDLRLRFVCTNSGGSPANRRGMAISWAELEIPDAGAARRIITIT